MKYYIVGTKEFRCYTGTSACTGLELIAITQSKNAAKSIVRGLADQDYVGLTLIFDENGTVIYPSEDEDKIEMYEETDIGPHS